MAFSSLGAFASVCNNPSSTLPLIGSAYEGMKSALRAPSGIPRKNDTRNIIEYRNDIEVYRKNKKNYKFWDLIGK